MLELLQLRVELRRETKLGHQRPERIDTAANIAASCPRELLVLCYSVAMCPGINGENFPPHAQSTANAIQKK